MKSLMIETKQNINELIYARQQNEAFFDILKRKNQQDFIHEFGADETKAKQINRFFKDIFSPNGVELPDGVIVMNVLNDYGCNPNMYFSAGKLCPKKDSTVSIGEIAALFGEAFDVCIHTGVFYYNEDHSHTEKNLKNIYCICLDIDNFCLEEYLSDEHKVEAIYNKYPIFKALPPSKIIDSGNKGFHVYYLFKEDIIIHKEKVREILATLSYILNADVTKATINNCLRVPYTINTKSGRTATIIYDTNTRYSLEFLLNHLNDFINNGKSVFFHDSGYCHMSNEDYDYLNEEYFLEDIIDCDKTMDMLDNITQFIPGFENFIDINDINGESFLSSNKNTTRTGIHKREFEYDSKSNIRNYYNKVLGLIKDNIFSHGGRVGNSRNNHLHIAAVCMKQLKMPEAKIKEAIYDMNEDFSNPLPYSQVKCLLQCDLSKNYRVSASYVFNALNISPEKMNAFGIAITKSQRLEKKSKRNKELSAKRKKARNTKAKRKKFTRNLKELYIKYDDKKLIIEQLKVSRSTFYRYVKMLGLACKKERLKLAQAKAKELQKAKAAINTLVKKWAKVSTADANVNATNHSIILDELYPLMT